METSTMSNPDAPATSRQLWALFCATKEDHREKGLTKAQAAELLDKLNDGRIRWTEKKVLSVISECRQAGQKAAESKLKELQAAGPAFAVCEETAPFSGQIESVVGTMLDVCGRAYFKISARGKFYTLCKKLSQDKNNRFLCSRHYYGGGSLSIFDMTRRQELSVNRAAYVAAAEILKKYNIENTIYTWVD